MIRKSTLLGIAALVTAAAPSVWADPLAGEQLKFYQSPLDGLLPPPVTGIYPIGATPSAADAPAPFPGHDELSTVSPQPSGVVGGTMMADDFSDKNPLPIGHITWWGSYMNPNTAPPNGIVPQFQVSLYTNAFGTSSAGQFSEPGQLIATQTLNLAAALSSSSGTFTQSAPIPDPGSPDGPLYEYNGELNWQSTTLAPFIDAVYPNVEWLSIVALSPNLPGTTTPEFQWGWHDRDYGIADPFAPAGTETPYPYHFLDDAVSGPFFNPAAVGPFAPQNYIPAYDGISSSKDLAFALYTVPVPEPLALPVLAAGMFLLRRHRRA